MTKNYGHPLRMFLSRNGMTARHFAKQIGVSSEQVSRWTANVCKPKPPTQILIERVTDGAVKREDW